MSSYTVNVSDIAPSTTQQGLNDFFAFCGQITNIEINEKATPKSAVVKFDKASAAKTALMLNGGTLDGSQLVVTSDQVHNDDHDYHTHDRPLGQSDKPRAGIAAEYLAKGYLLSDNILNRAIEIDNKQGISKRFLAYIQSLDSTIGAKTIGPDQTISGKVQEQFNEAGTQARSVDQKSGFSKTANDYYTKMFASPFGVKVRQFYTSTAKQVTDIHEEARRIADGHKATQAATAAANSIPPSAPGVAAYQKTA